MTLRLADYGYRTLRDVSGRQPDLPVSGTAQGRALSGNQLVDDGSRIHQPLARRGQVIGVLSLDSGTGPSGALSEISLVLCSALLASQGHSDVVPIERGASDLELAATVQHDLLPLPSYWDRGLEIGGQIEPAYDIAGDAFDYAVNGDTTHVAVFDAVGHGLRATLIAMTAVGAYRRERRISSSLAEIATGIDRALSPILSTGEFVTGTLLAIDPRRRRLEICNAGHLPLLLTRGARSTWIDGAQHLPFGLGASVDPIAMPVEPGDLLVMYTDGVVQARNDAKQMLGDAFLSELANRLETDESLAAMCRNVLDRVVGHVANPLSDDATVVALRLAS